MSDASFVRSPWRGACHRCVWMGQPRMDEQQAKSDAVWHVYEEHPTEWVAAVGKRPPRDFDPRAVN